MKKIFCFILITLTFITLTACFSEKKANVNDNSDAAEIPASESHGEKTNYSEYKQSVMLNIDDNELREDKINVCINSIEIEKNFIRDIEFDEISDFYNAVNSDMSINNGYVFIKINVSLLSEKSLDDVYLSNFMIAYLFDNNISGIQSSYQSEKLYPDSPHLESVIALKENEEKTVTVGYIVPEEILQANDINFISAFQENGGGDIDDDFYDYFQGAAIFDITDIIRKGE